MDSLNEQFENEEMDQSKAWSFSFLLMLETHVVSWEKTIIFKISNALHQMVAFSSTISQKKNH